MRLHISLAAATPAALPYTADVAIAPASRGVLYGLAAVVMWAAYLA